MQLQTMIFSQLTRSLTRRPVVVAVRNIAGLPKYDGAANIGMKQLWPAMVIIAGENFSLITSHLQSQVSTQDSMVSGCISTLSEAWTWTITSGRNKIKLTF